jgi:hypothetical protein
VHIFVTDGSIGGISPPGSTDAPLTIQTVR